MEDIEIINLWKSYDKKLNENLLLNRENAEEITKIKAQSLLSSMKPLKIFTMLVGIIWVAFVDVLIINLFYIANPFFLISAGIQSLLTTLAIGIYLYQLIIIHQVDISEPILATQEKIASLKSTTLWVARILFRYRRHEVLDYVHRHIFERDAVTDRKSTRLNSSHHRLSRMPSSA